MVSSLSIFFMIVSLIIQFFFPIGLAVYYYKKEKISFKPVLVGALVFFVFQIATRMPVLGFLSATQWYKGLAHNSIFLLSLFLAFTASLFEETGRFLGFKILLKGREEWKDGIAFGIGHGGLESIFIGLNTVNNLVLSIMINSGVVDDILGKQVPAQTLETIKNSLVNTSPSLFLAGGIERLFTVLVQIGFTMVVLYGVKSGKYLFIAIAILLHALVDLPLVFLQKEIGIWGTEAVIAIIGVISMVLVYKSRRAFDQVSSHERLG